ncbi:restriction endonuclease subunit S [Cronobacter dublinensis]
MAKYKAYPEYKTISSSWLDSIPNGWELLPLKYICTSFVKDGPHETPVFLEEGIPFLSVDGIQDNKLFFEGCRYISPSDHFRFSQKCKPVKGDVLLGKSASIGKVALVDTSREFNVWSPLAVITPIRSCLSKFIYYSLQTTMLQAQCEVYSNSNTQKNLGMSTIDNLEFAMPSDKEASTISNFLDHETAKIDSLIEKQKQLIELLKEKRQAVISHAVTKGLNPDVPMKDSGVEWLGYIPKSCIVTKLKYVTVLKTEKGSSNNTRYVGMENISSNTGKFLHKDEVSSEGSSVSFERGDILFGKLRPYLAKSWLATFSGVCSSEFLVFQSKKIHAKYLNYYLLTNEFIKQVDSSTYGSKMPRANWEFINQLPVPTWSYEESKAISVYLDNLTAKLDCLLEKQQQQIKLLQERRIALISAAVTGKIDVRDWRAPDAQKTEEPQEATI